LGYDNEFENTVFLNSCCIFIQLIEYSKVFFCFRFVASQRRASEVERAALVRAQRAWPWMGPCAAPRRGLPFKAWFGTLRRAAWRRL
jgi:hypothetical protein